ncbi:unnamed protein product [Oncorhynchus mykiss]|uniref:Uncharacterized protein n=1 Tax=Oncorhynchus mykiss TaxID=8022 RepID=A0A060XCU7_ONCMY|nr:unnamed protein product [Oncorhynchus mykiss]
MRVDRTVDIPVYDISLLRNIWEGREKKYKNKQKKEHERVQKSALAKINQQWQYRIACKTLKSNEVEVLQHYLTRTALNEIQPHQDIPNTGKLSKTIKSLGQQSNMSRENVVNV